MNVTIDPAVATALADLEHVDGVSTAERVHAILRHYLTDLHGRLAPAAASVAAVVTGEGLYRETLEGGIETSGNGQAEHDSLLRIDITADATEFEAAFRRASERMDRELATVAAEHAIEHRDDPTDIPGNIIPPDVTPDPADVDEPPEVDPLACTVCGFVAKAPQGLAAHRRKRHQCGGCGKPIVHGVHVPGLGGCCRDCARDAA